MSIPRSLFGHPLHPMLVYLPLSLWLSAFAVELLAVGDWGRDGWSIALSLTAMGVAIGLLAMILGLLDYARLSVTGSNDVRLAARHGVRTSSAWCLMLLKIVLGYSLGYSTTLLWVGIGLDVIALALLAQAAWFGLRISHSG